MWGIIETLLGSLTVAIVMLIAFGMPIGGVIMIKRGLRTQRLGIAPHCRECDYLLIGHFGDRCPECGAILSSPTGAPLDPERIIRGQKKRRPILLLGGFTIFVS